MAFGAFLMWHLALFSTYQPVANVNIHTTGSDGVHNATSYKNGRFALNFSFDKLVNLQHMGK